MASSILFTFGLMSGVAMGSSKINFRIFMPLLKSMVVMDAYAGKGSGVVWNVEMGRNLND